MYDGGRQSIHALYPNTYIHTYIHQHCVYIHQCNHVLSIILSYLFMHPYSLTCCSSSSSSSRSSSSSSSSHCSSWWAEDYRCSSQPCHLPSIISTLWCSLWITDIKKIIRKTRKDWLAQRAEAHGVPTTECGLMLTCDICHSPSFCRDSCEYSCPRSYMHHRPIARHK